MYANCYLCFYIMQSEGFRVTLWVHPFINSDCPAFTYAEEHGFLAKVGMFSWWSKPLMTPLAVKYRNSQFFSILIEALDGSVFLYGFISRFTVAIVHDYQFMPCKDIWFSKLHRTAQAQHCSSTGGIQPTLASSTLPTLRLQLGGHNAWWTFNSRLA